MKRWTPFLIVCCGMLLLLGIDRLLYSEQLVKANVVTVQQDGTVAVEQDPVTEDGTNNVFLPLITRNQQQSLLTPPAAGVEIGEPAMVEPSSIVNSADDITQDRGTLSATRPLTKSESYFFTDTGYQLDQYLFRNDVITTTGRLTFAINIDRYYSPLITNAVLTPDGLVNPATITNLINNHLLPPTATLTLELYDIDEKATGCAEVDHIYLNRQLVVDVTSGVTATISGDDRLWKTQDFEVPIGWLRFPVNPGSGGARPTALNEIAIDINTQCPTVPWALKVDWGAIAIPNPLHRPIVFVHGYADNSGTFLSFENFARTIGIPTKRDGIDLAWGIEPITNTAFLLRPFIDEALQDFGVDKVNLFAHSKGGLVSRYLLQFSTQNKKVEKLFTFGSPHHGHPAAPGLGPRLCPALPIPATDYQQCLDAANELSVDNIRTKLNYNPLCQADGTHCGYHRYRRAPNVQYFTLAGPEIVLGGPLSPFGDVGEVTATYPWNTDKFYPKNKPVVDASLYLDHFDIKQHYSAFTTTMQLLIAGSSVHASVLMDGASASKLTNEPQLITPSLENPTIINQNINLASGETQIFTLPVDGNTVLFYTLSDQPLTFSLVAPSGFTIDPTVAETDPAIFYSAVQGNPITSYGWSTQYQIVNPTPGLWQVVLTSTNNNSLLLYSAVSSTKQLRVTADKAAYQPGELVTLQAWLEENSTPLIGSNITGTVELPNMATLPLTFHDDGSNGDRLSNDGIYTSQFDAPSANSQSQIQLRAMSGNVVRLDDLTIDVVGPTATFQQVSSERVVDTNGNSLYDRLEIDLRLNVQTAGSYEIQGLLVDSSGKELELGIYNTPSGTSLATGLQTVTLVFDGETLRHTGSNGPYTLTNLFVQYNDPRFYSPFTVGLHQNVYTTTAYNYRQFEGYLFKLLNTSERVTDPDNDGLYNQLQINVQLDILAPGTYNWSGQLVDRTGASIGWDQGRTVLNSQTPITFTFAGVDIRDNELNGPYRLRNVAVSRVGGAPLSMYWGTVHTTAAYTATQFEQRLPCPGPIVAPVNAAFEQSVIELVNIERANQGLPPMKRVEDLMNAARYHASDMAQDGYLQHDTYDRINGTLTYICSWDQRLSNYYTGSAGAAENVASGQSSPTAVVAAWMASSGHRANILSNYREIGVGFNARYWVQDFGTHLRDYPLIINGEAATTASPNVTLYIYGSWTEIRLRNNDGAWSAWQPFSNTLNWTLDSTFDLQTVDAEMRKGSTTASSSDTIELAAPTPTPTPTATATPLPPAAPTLAQPENADNDGNFIVVWSTVPAVTGYELQERRSALIPPPYTTIYTGTEPSFAVSNRLQGGTYSYRVRTVRGAQSSGWSNVVNVTVVAATPTPTPTKTPTLTPTPTFTPTPTPIPTFVSNALLYMSSESGGTVSGIAFADEDILTYNTVTGVWAMLFDGSDVGATTDVDAVHVESDGSLLLSFDATTTLAGLGAVEDEDIVRFIPTTLGVTTAGSFAWLFDGSDVGLDTADEDIDAIARLADGRLVLSSYGNFSAGGISGTYHDLFVFNATSLGETTSGAWAMYLDGSDVGLTSASENIWGAEITPDGNIYITTFSTYAVPGLSGDGDDFFTCSSITLGDTSACNINLYWNGDNYGVGSEYLDALAITSTAAAMMASYQQSAPDPADLLVENDADEETEAVIVNEEAINSLYLPVVSVNESAE